MLHSISRWGVFAIGTTLVACGSTSDVLPDSDSSDDLRHHGSADGGTDAASTQDASPTSDGATDAGSNTIGTDAGSNDAGFDATSNDAQAGTGASWYVRPGGSGNGKSWVDAWGDVGSIAWSSINAGDTIWIAGGTYGSLTPGKSGTADTPSGRIFVKRATASTNGGDSGWNPAYDSQVSLASISWSALDVGSYVTIDGQVDSGIKVAEGGGDAATAVTFDRGANSVTLRYLELQGPGDVVGYHHSGDDRGIDITAWNGSSYDLVDNLKVQHTRIHGACTQLWIMNADNSLWEYNEIYNSHDDNGATCHPNIIATSASTNVTFRFNDIHDYDAEGIMMINGDSGTWHVYGNVFHSGLTYARVMESQQGTNGPVYFYNNTISDMWGGILTSNGGVWHSASQGRNNIWFSPGYQGFPSDDYDFCSGSCNGAHSISGGSNPFVNAAANDFHIVSTIGATLPRNKGTDLGASFGTDADGAVRGADGAWDIGAYEAK